ncbi:MAG TPA: GNAT family N-acetyltransferase [Verrucomicrobiae bacterium]|nr:GNAT family N-acetyltransferase [Verrucomicrobiae bacterium]
MSTLAQPCVFQRERDLLPLLALLGRLRAGPRGSHFLHPGGLQWLLRRLVNPDFAVQVWYDGTDLVAFVVQDGDYAMPHADPQRADVLDALAWAEAHARAAGQAAIEISVWDDNARLRKAVADRGYAPSGTFGPELLYRIGGQPPRPDLPDGFRFVAFDPSLDDAYVELHRDAWSTIAPSSYRLALHDIVTSMPFFDRELVPIVAAPDGTLAAYCIGWYDPVSRWTEIEPLGTRPAHRSAGLAHAVVREMIHRSWRRGAEAVMVWATDPAASAHVNEPARKLYISSGMKPERVIREYRRGL